MTKKNLLIKEKSPYLLQHAENPVNWYPWGEKAFKTAKKEDKPVFLSIGYSTCHWCHVMARESFEDKEVAKMINRVFIPIKVDREERPEIDKIYMNVCQAMTGSGGWPLTIFLTPDKRPFYAATYIPKHSKYGRKGIIDLITEIEKLWKKRREEVIKSAGNIIERLKKKDFITEQQADEKHLEETYIELMKNYDNNYGGFGHSTKFPTAHKLLFLIRYYKRTEEEKALKMVEETLQEMRKGGIYDHLGLGFHRYAMDRKWLIPHFEKMLYDQALLAYTYIEAYQATNKDIYKKISKEIFTYLKNRLYSSEGAFYAAENAESEGQEGRYYLWKKEEIKKILNKREMNVFNEIYNLNNINEFTNENINKYTLSLKNIEYVTSNEYKNINDKLLKHRDKRVKPSVDDKILTDWNGLVMAALARAGGIYNNKNYINTAEKLYSFIEKNIIIDDGKLYHCYCKGEASVEANIDDYSYLIWALLELYEATFNYKYIKKAEKLVSYTRENFWDEKNGGFYFASKNKKDLIIKQKEIYDGALPSGNSIICWNLIRLAHITDNMKYLDMVEDIVATFLKQAMNSPSNYCQYFCALDSLIGPFKDIFITGYKNDKRTEKMLNTLRENYIPKKTIVFQDQEYYKNKDKKIRKYAMTNGKATAYICKNFTCSKPTNNVEEMLDKINN